MKQYPRLISIAILCLALALLMAFTGADVRFSASSSVQLEGIVRETIHSAPPQDYETEKPVLVLYSPDRETSEKYTTNLCDTLDYLKWEHEKLDIAQAESISYYDYSMVVIATDNIEEDMSDDPRRILNYVADGGQLFFGMLQSEYGRNFQSIHHQLGIHEYTDYADYDKLHFNEDLLVGTTGQVLQDEELADICLKVSLRKDARVYLSAELEEETLPLFWTFQHENGSVGVFNASFSSGD